MVLNMIRIYNKNETDFTHNGLGILKDAISCIVEEELNGLFVATLEYPVNGFLSECLVNENIIKVPAGLSTGNNQLFKISNVLQSTTRIIVTAYHIFYDLKGNMLEDVRPTDLSGSAAINYILSNTRNTHNFSGFSDITNIGTAYYVLKNPVEALLGTDNCFTNIWGGELLRDNFLISMLQARGQDRGVKLRKGKNIKEIQWNINNDGVYTRIYPLGFNGLTIPEKYIDSPLINEYATIKSISMEFSNIKIDEENGITEEIAQQQLRDAVQEQFNNGIDKPTVNIAVDFIELSKIEQYKELYSSFESIYLGDTVEAIIGSIHLTLKVIRTTYNSLLEKFESFEIGDITNNYVSSAISQLENIKKTIENSNINILSQAKTDASSLIKTANGGYILKTQSELFIMDTNDINTAQKIWRWNQNGLGYSSTGINGEYGIAMTANGELVADFITTGKLNVSVIEGYGELITSVSNVLDNINLINETMSTIQQTILTQTAEEFRMWFEQTGIPNDMSALQNLVDSNNSSLSTLSQYIRFYEGQAEFGRSDSQVKLLIKNDRISFMTGNSESAYISNNMLYITDSTILNKLQIAKWVDAPDEYGNLNTSWVGEAI